QPTLTGRPVAGAPASRLLSRPTRPCHAPTLYCVARVAGRQPASSDRLGMWPLTSRRASAATLGVHPPQAMRGSRGLPVLRGLQTDGLRREIQRGEAWRMRKRSSGRSRALDHTGGQRYAAPMAKFPTDVDESVTIAAPRERVYAYLWDVVGSSRCVPDLATCERVGPDTYRFVSRERSAGPVSMVAR